MKEFYFISETHLGDCLLHTHFLNLLIKKYDDIKIYFYILEKHKKQVEEFIFDKSRIIALNYDDAPSNALRGWVGQFGIPPIPFNLCQLRLFSYKNLCKYYLNLDCPFETIIDLLPYFDITLNTKAYNNWDILFINSQPLSNQISESIYEEEFLEKFKNKKIITTKKIKNIPCTLDYNYSVYDIGFLSLNINKIIGINTGPWFSVMNKNNLNKNLYYIDDNCKFSYKNCINIKNLKVFI